MPPTKETDKAPTVDPKKEVNIKNSKNSLKGVEGTTGVYKENLKTNVGKYMKKQKGAGGRGREGGRE